MLAKSNPFSNNSNQKPNNQNEKETMKPSKEQQHEAIAWLEARIARAETTPGYPSQALGLSVADGMRLLTVMRQLEQEVAELRIRNALWDATFSKYESWKANEVPARDWPPQVLMDFHRCSAIDSARAKESKTND